MTLSEKLLVMSFLRGMFGYVVDSEANIVGARISSIINIVTSIDSLG